MRLTSSAAESTPDSRPWLLQSLALQRGEVGLVFWSFLYFFSLLSAYYVIRPVRDEMGILGGIDNLPWLFSATFVAMLLLVPLFGALSSRLPRHRLLPVSYLFFIANLLLFYWAFKRQLAPALLAQVFFVWVSVFNLFVVSVFWSFMADIFNSGQAKRVFGVIAAGGTLGAISGPGLTAWLAPTLGVANLLLVSALLLGVALLCIAVLLLKAGVKGSVSDAALRGSILAGLTRTLQSRYLLGIALFIWLYTMLSTFLYFEQAHIVKAAFEDSAQRTRLFAMIDFSVNSLTLLLQLLVTARLLRRFGLGVALASVPALLGVGLAVLALLPVWPVLVLTQIVRRAGNFAITKPAREVLFTTLPREDKYKSKNFIDTVVYRGGDAVSAWLFAGLKGLGLGLSGIAWIAVPFALIWLALGLALGKAHGRRVAVEEESHVQV